MKRKKLMKGIILPCLCLFLMTACSNKANDNTNKENSKGWQIVKKVPITHKANKVAFYNLDYGITVGYNGEIHYTTDQGETWPRAENQSHCQFGAEIVNEKVSYSVGNHKHLVKTVDGGKTWSRITDFGGATPNQCQMVSFINEKVGMIASQVQLAFTKDGGATWVEQKAPSKIMSIYMVNETDAYLVGLDKKLYVTKDAGVTWKNVAFDIEGFEDENTFSTPQACTLTISEDGKGQFLYLAKGGVLRCFETEDGFATVSKTCELNFSEKMSSSNKMYLSRDGKYLTLQSILCDEALILTYAE
ncbi:MAG: hypothetical protein GX206_07420 [Clostridiales bacterium]|nr:hypothetical protein [Clostridiales bacterium]